MLDIIFYILFTRTFVIIALLFGTKIFLLITSEYRSKSLSKFFYYPYMNLVLTTNPKKIRYKKHQNNLTYAIIGFFLIQVVFLAVLYSINKV